MSRGLSSYFRSATTVEMSSCTRPTANQFRLFLHAGAYWLMWGLRAAMPKRSSFAVAQFDTLRLPSYQEAPDEACQKHHNGDQIAASYRRKLIAVHQRGYKPLGAYYGHGKIARGAGRSRGSCPHRCRVCLGEGRRHFSARGKRRPSAGTRCRLHPAVARRSAEKAAERSSIVLVDELDHGLEPHRIIRPLGALGAKETPPLLQVFMTTYSQVAVVEFSADQLHVVRRRDNTHEVLLASSAGDVQGTIWAEPQAMLAGTILVCEGATEVGLIRSIDQFYDADIPIAACSSALVDGKGTNTFTRALALQALGYRTGSLAGQRRRSACGD